MNDLDSLLARLAQTPPHPSLELMEARVLARIAARPVARTSLGISAMTIAVALVMGILGAGVPAKQASVVSLVPLEPGFPLAPSTLLAHER